MVLRENFSPTYFLSSLASGGLSVSFFIYLMFLVPHEDRPIPIFWDILKALSKGDYISFITAFSIVFIIAFAIIHFKLLIWNIKQFRLYKKSNSYKNLQNSNSQISFMTLPLTFTMSINLIFILSVVFIPGFWNIVEYLFPFALIGLGINGLYALIIFFNYFTRIMLTGDFDFIKNNNLIQMISIFTISMIAIGFVAPASISTNIIISRIGVFFALFFATFAAILVLFKIIFGFKNILKEGIDIETAPSLWMLIPISTLIGVTFIRVIFGIEHTFEASLNSLIVFLLLSIILTLQIIFGVFGYLIIKKVGYLKKFIDENNKTALSFALNFPGIAFFIFGMFFINVGLLHNNFLDKYSSAYFILMIPFIFVQIRTIILFFKLKKKFEI